MVHKSMIVPIYKPAFMSLWKSPSQNVSWNRFLIFLLISSHNSWKNSIGIITTLALGSRPRQGFARLRTKKKPKSEGKCEGMNPHTPKGASILGVWNLGGLSNFQRAITGVKMQWIEEFFISLKIY